MRIYRSVATVIGSLGLAAIHVTAVAGSCGYAGGCDTGVVINGSVSRYGPMTVNIEQPYGHLRQVHYNRAPNVSITRVHGLGPVAGLSDAPSGFTQGCHPTSTQYCRAQAPAPKFVQPPVYQPPVIQTPIIRTPVVSAPPMPAPRRFVASHNYDASLYQSRQYGQFTFTPGTAYIPTSHVNRDPAAAQALLNSGRTVAQSTQLGGMAPTYNMGHNSHQTVTNTSYSQAQSVSVAPPRPVSNISQDGSYWEQVSGPTMFGNTLATQVVCKRQAPVVTRPVINVPVPVPTPVGCYSPNAPTLAGGPTSAWSY